MPSSPSVVFELRQKLALMVIVGPSGRYSPEELARAAVAGGATAIQLRWKEATSRQLVDLGHTIREIIADAGLLLIVNDRVDVAMAIGADGVHLGDDDLPLTVVRKIARPGLILGRSVDTAEEAMTAEKEGADYVGLGPINPTSSKHDVGPVVGLAGIAAVRGSLNIPIVAIGGIDQTNAAAAIAAGADGVAVLSAVSGAADPQAATRALARKVGRDKRAKGEG